jgi:putative ABC transport system permease protein
VRFVTIPLRNLGQRPLRTVLTILGVAAAVGGFSILTGLGRGVEDAWNGSLVGQGTQLFAYRKGVLDLLAGTIDEHLAGEVRKVSGVESVAAELVDVLTLESGASILVRGWEAESHLWRETSLLAGRLPAGGVLEEVVVGEALAESLGLGPGSEVQPFGTKLQVVGVVRMDGVLSNNSLIMSLVGLQELLDRGRKITVLHIRVERGRDQNQLEVARSRLGGLFPQFAFVAAQTAAQQNEMYRFAHSMAWAVSLVGLAMGLLLVVNTLLVAVLERTREIGVLAAVGWSRRRILALVLLESLLLSAAGGLVGMTLGHFGLKLLVLHPKLRGIVAVVPSLSAFGQQFLVIVLLGIGAGFLPAWRALELNPVDALRER